MKNSTGTATTATAERPRPHIGRFAPSPSGELHLGSLYTAVASYLDARSNGGRWLVRIEDIDLPRVIPGAAAEILRTLDRFGFEWDGAVIHQSDRRECYEAALESCRARGLTFECSCSRSQLADGDRYPGNCRAGPLLPGQATAIRLTVAPGALQFTDRIQGIFRQDVATTVGDFVVRRRDGLFAYVLAVVVDDAAQGVTHVVRGADLLDDTPRQIYLQRILGAALPVYAHVPVLTEADGKKLAKSARTVGLSAGDALAQLLQVFRLLGLSPDLDLGDASLPEAWQWAMNRWRIDRVPKRLSSALAPHFP